MKTLLKTKLSMIAITVLCAVLNAGCTIDPTARAEEPLAHLVLVWMKEPGNAAHRAQLVSAGKRLEAIDGVVRVKVGQSIASDRPVVDDSFDIGMYIELASPQALRAYATDPLHLDILKNDLAPLTARYIVYDFEIDR